MKKIVLLTAIALGLAANFSARTAQAQEAPRRIEIVSSKYAYAPNEITVKKGETVTIVLKSADVQHGIEFKELHFTLNVAKGATGEMNLTPDQIGDFVGICSKFCGLGHNSMKMTIHVIP